MNINECTAIAADADFRARLKFILYRKAVSVLKSQSPPAGAASVARAVLADQAPLERLALAAVTESAFSAAADYAAITDDDIEAAALSVIVAFMA